MQRRPDIIVIKQKRYFQKHTAGQRFQSVVQILSVLVLIVTGLPVRHSDEGWASAIYSFLGGPEVVPNIHRAAGVILLSIFVFHTVYWIRLFFSNHLAKLKNEKRLTPINIVKEFFSQTMIMNKKDFVDVIQHFKYILFISDKPAEYGRIIWKDKFEYYSQYWGITVIGIAGIALWWRDELTQILPGIVLNAAYIMHSYEALLALLFLIFIHWYHEFYCPEKFPIPTGFFSGYVSENQMIHEHYSRYVELMKQAGLEKEIISHEHH